MKNLIFSSLFLIIGFPALLNAQTTVVIKGIVKSPDGAVQGARVDIFDVRKVLLDNSITGPTGSFRSERKIKIGTTIKIKISKLGYETAEIDYEIDSKGDAGQFLLQFKKLFITGTVRDSTTEQALQHAEISFYEQSGRLIQAKSTNSLGYFEIETDFIYGQKITVKAFKKGYFDKEQTFTITSDDRNTMQDIMLPDVASRGLRAFIRVRDKKTGRPLEGVSVQYMDQRNKTYLDTLLSIKGEIELRLFQKPGSILDFTISRPGYVNIAAQRTLSAEPRENVFPYEMERDKKSALGPILLIGGGASAVASGFMYFSSQSMYKDYKNYANYTDAKNREADFTKAQQKRDIAVAAAGVAAGAIIIYIIYKISEKNKVKAAIRKKIQFGFIQPANLNTDYAVGIAPIIGIGYHF
ncbi:MAG: carboxypeptidase-like regulatory domain-containing protein [Ferruginibacter sp.]